MSNIGDDRITGGSRLFREGNIVRRTVIVPTNVVDGVIRLNEDMNHRLVTRYDTGDDQGNLTTVCVFEGVADAINLNRFYISQLATNSGLWSRFYDADGHFYEASPGDSAVNVVRFKRANRSVTAFVDLDRLDAVHGAWKETGR